MSVVSSKKTRPAVTRARTEPKPELTGQPPASRSIQLSAPRALTLPLVFTLGLAAFGLLSPVRMNPRLLWAFLGAAAALFAWNAVLLVSALRKGRTLTLAILLQKQHYLQACAQGSVLLYWGWYWSPVYDSAYLIAGATGVRVRVRHAARLVAARHVHARLRSFPVIFSINLFLWFKADWFYLQFLMVAVGFAAKELIRWDKEGRRTHIFNPSSFPLAVFSLGLLLTGTSSITWGPEIASTQFFPPHIYLMLFLIGLPGQFFFGVTTMTMSAVVVTYLFGLAYFAVTGIYFFSIRTFPSRCSWGCTSCSPTRRPRPEPSSGVSSSERCTG